MEVSTEEVALMGEHTEELAHAEASIKEVDPTEEPTEEPAAPVATISGPAEEPNTPPVWCREKGKGEVPCCNFSGWMEVLHPTWSVIPTIQTPLTLSELRQRCHSWSGGMESPASKN